MMLDRRLIGVDGLAEQNRQSEIPFVADHANFDAETIKRGSGQRKHCIDRKVRIVDRFMRHPEDHAALQRNRFHRGIQESKIRLTQRTQNEIVRL